MYNYMWMYVYVYIYIYIYIYMGGCLVCLVEGSMYATRPQGKKVTDKFWYSRFFAIFLLEVGLGTIRIGFGSENDAEWGLWMENWTIVNPFCGQVKFSMYGHIFHSRKVSCGNFLSRGPVGDSLAQQADRTLPHIYIYIYTQNVDMYIYIYMYTDVDMYTECRYIHVYTYIHIYIYT